MAKLIVSQRGEVIDNHFLKDASFTIGSLAESDLRLLSNGVSRTHARITSVGNDDIIEDAGSTNGTLVNGRPIDRHILQNDDVIEIADIQIRYRNHKAVEGPSFDRTMIIQAANQSIDAPSQPMGAYSLATAKKELRFKKGGRLGLLRPGREGDAGPDIELIEVLHSVGTPGKQLAVINSRPHGYFITHVEGEKTARLNGKPIGHTPRALNANDLIEADQQVFRFLLK